jgi:predicted Zn-dependent protease
MVGGTVRKAKWMWESLAGSEADAVRAEHEVGRDMAAIVRERTPCDADPEVQAFLDGIGQQLARSVRNRLHRFRVTAIAEDHPTAFALPGGFIFVAQSLVELCDKDRDEAAFVIAHEMAHVIRRHAINRLLRQTALSAASLASPGRGWLAPWIRRVGLQWLESAHSREHEFEADALGGLLMRAAGFDPAGAIRLLERLRGLDQTSDRSGLGVYFQTHPAVEDRILNLRRRLTTTG